MHPSSVKACWGRWWCSTCPSLGVAGPWETRTVPVVQQETHGVASETSGILHKNLGFPSFQIQISFRKLPKLSVFCRKKLCVWRHVFDLEKGNSHLSAFRQLCLIILRHLPWPPSVCSMLHAMKNGDVVPGASWAEAMGNKRSNTSSTTRQKLGRCEKIIGCFDCKPIL